MHQCINFIYSRMALFDVSILMCFFGLFGTDKFDVHRAVHRNIILKKITLVHLVGFIIGIILRCTAL